MSVRFGELIVVVIALGSHNRARRISDRQNVKLPRHTLSSAYIGQPNVLPRNTQCSVVSTHLSHVLDRLNYSSVCEAGARGGGQDLEHEVNQYCLVPSSHRPTGNCARNVILMPAVWPLNDP